ncbi:MAG TPA: hypothetical protein VNN19_11510 [bacterium]|nr:hypothetical protein [bacterium]
MQNLRRIGAEAGILAGIATGLLFLGFVWFFPQAGLTMAGQASPHAYMKFIGKHEMLFWTVNVLGGLLAALMSAVLFRTLEDRFEGDAPASARIGALFGIGGAFGFAASALVRQVGFSAAAKMYATNQSAAVQAFRAVQWTEQSMFALGQVAVGLGAIVLGIVMLQEKRYGSVGYLSAVAGTTMFLGAFISHVVLFMGSFALMAGWLIWTAMIVRGEAGPGLIRIGANGRSRASRQAA